jgi:nucleoside-diphosphate-sugar epimerase
VIHSEDRIAIWICLAPIWVLPDHFALLEAHGARRVVALSSTSRYTKQSSPDPHEQALSRRLAEGEAQFMAWAGARGVTWTILQPTLIYGLGRDRNIGAIAHFIRRFGFFPLCGPARGLRQPLHAEDVAAVCLAAIEAVTAANRTYTISGGEMLSYREMVDRVFAALGRRSRFLTIPPVLLRLALACWRVLPGEHTGSVAMAERMNQDLVFDHADAARDLGFAPRSFHPTREDLPS